MSAATLPNTSCGRCHTSASELGKPLMECAACHSVLYCSKNCQRGDWKEHKPQCQQLQAGVQPDRVRTTMRVSLADLLGDRGLQGAGASSSRDSPDTVYYLKTSTPHLYDVSVSGPYKDLEAVHHQAMINFGPECPSGREALEDFVQDGRFIGFERISSPISGDPNKIRRVELVRKVDANLAARLPCAVWNVLVSAIATEALSSVQPGSQAFAPVKDINIRGSFYTEAMARESAHHALQGLAGRSPGFVARTLQESPFTAGILNTQAGTVEFMVQVVHDQGTN